MKKLLISGFDPFGGESINPAWETVKLLPDQIGDHTLEKVMVPTVYGEAGKTLIRKYEEIRPDAVIMVGQAGGADSVRAEVVAVNIRDARIPDNKGNQPWDVPVVKDGPNAYFSSMPLHDIVPKMIGEGLNIRLSYSAGTFVCNDIYYTACHYLSGGSVKACFIHVPYLPEQAGEKYPSMTQGEMISVITRFIELI